MIIPNIYQTYLEDLDEDNYHPSLIEFLGLFGLKNITIPTTWRWMNYIGFKFDERRKTYFSDRHEDESNVKYREKFTQEYFTYEKQSYRWIQLEEATAIQMEQDEVAPLVKNCYFEYVVNNKKMRDYHQD